MRVLVCGGRDYKHVDRLYRALDGIKKHCGGEMIVIHGACPTGADYLADEWAAVSLVERLAFPADWSLGKKAGPLRNQRMLDEGKPDLVLAFPGGRGTADMVRRARAAGIEVKEIAP